MSEEKPTAYIVGVSVSVTVLMVHPVITNPLMYRSLEKKTLFILYYISGVFQY